MKDRACYFHLRAREGVRVSEATPSELDQQIAGATLRAAHAQSRDCKLSWARQVIDMRFRRGDFPIIQAMDAATREALAIAMINNPEQKQ